MLTIPSMRPPWLVLLTLLLGTLQLQLLVAPVSLARAFECSGETFPAAVKVTTTPGEAVTIQNCKFESTLTIEGGGGACGPVRISASEFLETVFISDCTFNDTSSSSLPSTGGVVVRGSRIANGITISDSHFINTTLAFLSTVVTSANTYAAVYIVVSSLVNGTSFLMDDVQSGRHQELQRNDHQQPSQWPTRWYCWRKHCLATQQHC